MVLLRWQSLEVSRMTQKFHSDVFCQENGNHAPTQMFRAASFIAAKKEPPTAQWTDKTQLVQPTEGGSSDLTWLTLEDTLSESSRTQKPTCCRIPLMWNVQNGQILGGRRRWEAAGGGEKGGCVLPVAFRRRGEKVMELASGGDCMTLEDTKAMEVCSVKGWMVWYVNDIFFKKTLKSYCLFSDVGHCSAPLTPTAGATLLTTSPEMTAFPGDPFPGMPLGSRRSQPRSSFKRSPWGFCTPSPGGTLMRSPRQDTEGRKSTWAFSPHSTVHRCPRICRHLRGLWRVSHRAGTAWMPRSSCPVTLGRAGSSELDRRLP